MRLTPQVYTIEMGDLQLFFDALKERAGQPKTGDGQQENPKSLLIDASKRQREVAFERLGKAHEELARFYAYSYSKLERIFF